MTRDELRDQGFTKGIPLPVEGSGAIWIVAQEGVPDLAVARAHRLLRFFLRPLPGATPEQIAEKQAVARCMVNNGALLAMPTGAHEEDNEPDLPAQPLYQDETPVDGSAWYLSGDPEHRDAAFEEIFHLVHDTGIGTVFPGAMPDYQRDLDREARAAMRDGRWGRAVFPEVADWLEELEAENSLAQEYIASVIDTYYGLWGASPEPGGMGGVYCAGTRDEQARLDPRGQELLRRFLPAYLVGYEALIDPGFEGTFSLVFDPAEPYTHKSQYLVEVRLTGTNSSHLIGNDQDNVLTGNGGDNLLDGGAGRDAVCFPGPAAHHTLRAEGGDLIVTDTTGGNGVDRLRNVEEIRWSDDTIDLSTFRREGRRGSAQPGAPAPLLSSSSSTSGQGTQQSPMSE